MEISRMLTLSTAHITEETAIGLTAAAKNMDSSIDLCVYEKGEYGFLIHIPDEEYEAPSDLRDCIELADNNHCQWLCLDRDGDVTEKLHVYAWGQEK